MRGKKKVIHKYNLIISHLHTFLATDSNEHGNHETTPAHPPHTTTEEQTPSTEPTTTPVPAAGSGGNRILRFEEVPPQQQVQQSPELRALRGVTRACFSGDTVVRTTGGEKFMSELEVGDMVSECQGVHFATHSWSSSKVLVPVSANSFKLERVEMFYHREPETVARFVHIKTEQGPHFSSHFPS